MGDSITAGSGASSASTAYPAVLDSLLGNGWDVRNFGNSGKTAIKKPSDGASYWSTTQFTQSQSFQPDVVVLMLGTNDSKTSNWNSGNNTYAVDYAALVTLYTGLASKPKVYAMLPIPALSSQYNISASAIQNGVIPAIKQIVAQAGIELIDLNTVFAANQPASLLGDDQIHPNDKGYRFIAETVAAVLQQGAAGSPSGAAGSSGAGGTASSAGAGGYAGASGATASSGAAGAAPRPSGAGSSAAGFAGASNGGGSAGSAGAAAANEPTLPSAGSASVPAPAASDNSAGCQLGAPLSSGALAWLFAPLGVLTLLRRRQRKAKPTAR